MPDLVLYGLGANETFGPFLTKLLGFKPEKRGNDWVIPEQGLCSIAKKAQILKAHQQISLEQSSTKQCSKILAAFASNTFDEYLPKSKSIRLSSYDPSSATNEVYAIQLELLGTPRSRLAELFEKKVIPLMRDRFGATHVTTITTDAKTQQAFLSLTKIALLLKKGSDIDEIRRLVFERRILGGILPPQTNALAYVNCLTRLIPSAISLPLSRMDCEWNFQCGSVYEFGHTDGEGLYQQFIPDLAPGTKYTRIINWQTLVQCDADFCWHYLRYASQAINTLYSFLNDPSNFLGHNGEIDLAKQIQAHGAIYLIFSDINAMSFSSNQYNCISFAMSALDKLSNLIKHLGPSTLKEEAIFTRLVSTTAGEQISGLLAESSRIHGSDFSKGLSELCRSVYRHFHNDLRSEALVEGNDESCIERFRAQRNLRHGTFLNGDSFLKIYGSSQGDAPPALPQLVLQLTLAMAASPKELVALDILQS